MDLAQARHIAECLIARMRPCCDRIEIAGSIRRGKPQVKDIEIVAIPKRLQAIDESDLFGESMTTINLLHQWATTELPSSLQWIKTGTHEIVPWFVQADGKYWRGYIPQHDIKVDIFLTEPDRWGATYLVRTGSAEFNAALLQFAKGKSYRFDDGGFCHEAANGKLTPLPVPEEADIFRRLGLDFIPPTDRINATVITRGAAPRGKGVSK